MAKSVKVQRGSASFSGTSTTASIDSVNLDNAFVFLTNVRREGKQNTSTNRNIAVNAKLTNDTTISFTRDGSATGTVVVRYEVWEYVGPGGGDDEFKVRFHDIVVNDHPDLSGSIAVSGTVDNTKLVPIVCGIRNNGSFTNIVTHQYMVGTSGSNITFIRGNTSAGQANNLVSFAAIEFTGDNWTVEQNLEHFWSGSGNAIVPLGTSVTDWDKSIIFSSFKTDPFGNRNDESTDMVWPGPNLDHIFMRRDPNASVNATTNTFIVQNAGLTIQHLDSVIQSESSLSSSVQNKSITTLDSLLSSSMLAYIVNDDETNSFGTHWNYRIDSTSQITFERGVADGTCDWSAQIITWPELFVGQTIDFAGQGIQSAELWGDHTVVPGGITIDFAGQGIPSAELWGDHTVVPGGITIDFAGQGIPSAEAWGSHSIANDVIIDFAGQGIPSAELWGNHTIRPPAPGVDSATAVLVGSIYTATIIGSVYTATSSAGTIYTVNILNK